MSETRSGGNILLSRLVEARCELAEGPQWFEHRWWWVDIEAGSLYSCDSSGDSLWSHSFGQRLAAFAAIGENRFLLALQQGIALWHRASDSLSFVAFPDAGLKDNRCNDGKLDPAGRFVFGTMSMTGQVNAGGLYSLELPDTLTKRLSGVGCSNGLAWSQDGKTLFHIDSLSYAVKAYDYDLSTGEMSPPRTVVRVPREFGLPDGMDIDRDGNLWVAHWEGWAVRCWSPKSGDCLAKIAIPCARPTSCSFGGENFDQLLITTARVGLSAEDLSTQPLAGGVFTCRVF
jgi:sugar lactone lactonase YvrE